MRPTEQEFEELRAQVARLEAKLEGLVPHQTGQPPVLPAGEGLPPVLRVAEAGPPAPPVLTRPAAPARRGKLREVSPTAWIAGIGAVIFLIGVIYGLTVSIQRGWISPPVRVAAGMVTGLVFGAGAVRLLRRPDRMLGVTLLAVGAGTWSFALYFGAKTAHLFPLGLGLAGAAVATLFCGGLAARVRSDGAMGVALATGLVAPLAFSDGSGTLPALLGYLFALLGAQLAVHYLSGTGAGWRWSRLLGVAGVCFVALLGASGGRNPEPALGLALLAVLGAGVLVLAWLPRHAENPWRPDLATVAGEVLLALAAWQVWQRAQYEPEWFSLVLVALAAVSLALVPAGRRRVGTGGNDLPLLLLAAGFALVAVPVAFDWKWVVVAWGAGAVLVAWAARSAALAGRTEAMALQLVAGIAATAASAVWLNLAWEQGATDWIFLNRVFAGAVFAAGAWAVLVATPGQTRAVAYMAMQAVAVNAVAWEFSRAVPSLQLGEVVIAVGGVLATLTYAVAGAVLWLRGVTGRETDAVDKALRLAGYGWLTVAGLKLFTHDLAGRDLLFRAVAALGVGAVFIGAALWAGRQREKSEGVES